MIETAVEAARIGGKILLDAFGTLDQEQIRLKGMGDYVTELDNRSEHAIVSHIRNRFPDHSIIAEESNQDKRESPYCWLIDPLDGTANYVQGIPIFAVSIALLKNDEVLLGVVFCPCQKELFQAEKGKGAFLNGRKINVSPQTNMKRAMLGTGFPWKYKQNIDPYISVFKDLFTRSAGIRRMGAAAVDLAYTACGRLDGFWEMKLSPWDIGVGVLLVQEAGGVVTDFNGGCRFMETGNVVAANPNIHRNLLEVIKRHLSHIK